MLSHRNLDITFFIVAIFFLTGCSSQLNTQNVRPAYTYPDEEIGEASSEIPDYIIQAGDKLEIKFFHNKELNEIVTVRPDGKMALQIIDEVRAAGKTPSQLDSILTEKYAAELRDPILTVILRSFTNRKVFVGGEVKQQGIIDYTKDMTVLQAVYMAQGFGEGALPEEAIVIRKDSQNRPMPVRVDITNIIDNNYGANFRLQPKDVVYVPSTAIAQGKKFTNDYIRGLLMFNGFGANFDYQLNELVN